MHSTSAPEEPTPPWKVGSISSKDQLEPSPSPNWTPTALPSISNSNIITKEFLGENTHLGDPEKKNKVTIDIWLMGGQRKGEKNSSSTKKNKWIFESVAPFLTYVFLTERFWFLVLFDFQDVFCGSFLDCLTPEWPGLRLATLFQEICFPKPLGARSLATSKYI